MCRAEDIASTAAFAPSLNCARFSGGLRNLSDEREIRPSTGENKCFISVRESSAAGSGRDDEPSTKTSVLLLALAPALFGNCPFFGESPVPFLGCFLVSSELLPVDSPSCSLPVLPHSMSGAGICSDAWEWGKSTGPSPKLAAQVHFNSGCRGMYRKPRLKHRRSACVLSNRVRRKVVRRTPVRQRQSWRPRSRREVGQKGRG